MNPNTQTREFSLWDPDGYYVTISELSALTTNLPFWLAIIEGRTNIQKNVSPLHLIRSFGNECLLGFCCVDRPTNIRHDSFRRYMTVRSVTRRELAEDERILRTSVATMRRDGKKLDGELCLTNCRIVFVGMDQNRTEWSLLALVSAKMNNTLIFCDDGIKLVFSDGCSEVFILHNREEWVVDILAAKVAPARALRIKEEGEPLLDYDRGALRENLMKVCNQNELRTLTFELGVDLENLSGDNKEDKVRELIRYCERAGKLRTLLVKCRNLNPNISWPRV